MEIWGPVGKEGFDELQADSGMAGRPARTVGIYLQGLEQLTGEELEE